MIRTALLIDGGAPRAWARARGLGYSGDLVEDLAAASIEDGERLLRVLYYDCEPFEGIVRKPVSGAEQEFRAVSRFLDDLASRERFAVRRGELVFRGWQLASYSLPPGMALSDAHFMPRFEQKGVDMRIGLDIANFTERRSVDRLLLIAIDNDMVPAMKYARRGGLEVGIVQLPPPYRLTRDLLAHADFVRQMVWNDGAEQPAGAAETAGEHYPDDLGD